MNNDAMIPQYSTLTFTDIWDSAEDFKADFIDSPFSTSLGTSPIDYVSTVFYLLYARYGNNPIANLDITQWKFKIFSVIFQYGPTWQKRLEIQAKLRGLTDNEILLGSKAIYNHAFNPSTTPSTGSLDELTYINDQSTSNYKKSKMDAYMQLWELLRTDITEQFLNQFRKCFKLFVSAEQPLLYVSDTPEEEGEE
jgi:hypothetical protein